MVTPPDAVPAIPDGASLWHVGVHKTGTTALQAALAAARPELRAAGVLYPGRTQAQHAAALAVLGRSWGWQDKGAVAHPDSRFTSLVSEVRGWSGRSVVSSEHLCEADDAVAARIADSVGRERLHVVLTVRSLGRLLPSSWQQYLKFGFQRRYDKWLENQFAADPQPRRFTPGFWVRNDLGGLAERWAGLLGPDRVTFVVLEDVGPDAVYRAFAGLLGVPADVLLAHAGRTSNRSLTAAESELLRRVNLAVRADLTWPQYESIVRDGLVRRLVEERVPPPSEARLATPAWALDAAAERGAAQVAAIRAAGVRVVGPLDALAARLPDEASAAYPPEQLPTDLAAEAVSLLVRAQAAGVEAGGGASGARARRLAAAAAARLRR